MITFKGLVWRIVFAGQDATLSARSPEGRFHHAGQRAIYTSLSVEGCSVAIARYLGAGDPARKIVTLTINAERILDMRGNKALSVVWQNNRAIGEDAPTWAFSDAARSAGAQGMLYSSRSRPDLSHLVLFSDADAIGLEVLASRDWPL